MNVHTHIIPTYTLELTQDEYVALIAALFTSKKEHLIKQYGKEFPQHIIDSMDKAQEKLASKFNDIYQKETSVGIIKKIRLDGINIEG